MKYQLRHAGSPKVLDGLTAQHIADGLRDGRWEGIDEVRVSGETAWQPLENHAHFAELALELEAPPPPRHEEPTNLDMNALIDVCLVLLIFFILTTSYALAVQRVVPVPAVQKEGKKARIVTVSEVNKKMIRLEASRDVNGRLQIVVARTTRDVVDGEGNIDKGRLAEILAQESKGDVIRTELLLDARNISWGTFIAIQDAARSAGIDKIHHLRKGV